MNAKRLLKLADFLDTLPLAKFDFGVIAQQEGKPMRAALRAGKTRCGTVGCAIGWMPAVFPRGLRWDERRYKSYPDVVLRSDPDCIDFAAAATWFGITRSAAEQLFTPGAGYSGLPENATPKQVARHIRKWVRAQLAAPTSRPEEESGYAIANGVTL